MERNRLFDSLKFILICLVVFGHVIEKDVNTDHLKQVSFVFIYSFHMPLFIFISGYFSKNITWDKFKKGAVSLLLTYILFQTLFSTYDIIVGKFSFGSFLMTPKSVLWYIFCLVFWRFFYYCIIKFKLPFLLAFPVSLALGISMGFMGSDLTIMRMFTFFPFFLLGCYCSPDIIQRIRAINKLYVWSFLIVVGIGIYLFANKVVMLNLFFSNPYKAYCADFTYLGPLFRILTYFAAIVMSACIINVASEKFYKLGSTTIAIYLLHPFYLYYIYNTLLERWNIEGWYIIDILASVIITCICLLLFKLKFMQYAINPVSLFQKR